MGLLYLLYQGRKKSYNTKSEGRLTRLATSCVGTSFLYTLLETRQETIAVRGRRGRRLKQLLDYLKEMRGCWKFKEETP